MVRDFRKREGRHGCKIDILVRMGAAGTLPQMIHISALHCGNGFEGLMGAHHSMILNYVNILRINNDLKTKVNGEKDL